MPAPRIRITGGSARGLPLAEPRGRRLRPTSGLLREAIFNIIADRVPGAVVLDLYAGTGALGLEALSRGARSCVFIDSEAASCQAILQSLGRAGFTSAAVVLRGRLPRALDRLEGEFGLVLLDPPYRNEDAAATLGSIAPHLAAGGLVVYEHGSRYNPPERPAGLRLLERRVYGDSAIALYAPQEEE